MKINKTTRNDLAKALYAFEDPDSELFRLDKNTSEFDSELESYKKNYDKLPNQRKKGLEQAVSWILTQKINSKKDIPDLVPDLYRRI